MKKGILKTYQFLSFKNVNSVLGKKKMYFTATIFWPILIRNGIHNLNWHLLNVRTSVEQGTVSF